MATGSIQFEGYLAQNTKSLSLKAKFLRYYAYFFTNSNSRLSCLSSYILWFTKITYIVWILSINFGSSRGMPVYVAAILHRKIGSWSLFNTNFALKTQEKWLKVTKYIFYDVYISHRWNKDTNFYRYSQIRRGESRCFVLTNGDGNVCLARVV